MHVIHRRRKMLKVGGATDIIARENCRNHAHLLLKPRPFGVLLLLGQWWQEFLGRNEE